MYKNILVPTDGSKLSLKAAREAAILARSLKARITAVEKNCDVIVMASHGRGSLAGVLLGSETTKVLSNSKTPVLVCR